MTPLEFQQIFNDPPSWNYQKYFRNPLPSPFTKIIFLYITFWPYLPYIFICPTDHISKALSKDSSGKMKNQWHWPYRVPLPYESYQTSHRNFELPLFRRLRMDSFRLQLTPSIPTSSTRIGQTRDKLRNLLSFSWKVNLLKLFTMVEENSEFRPFRRLNIKN